MLPSPEIRRLPPLPSLRIPALVLLALLSAHGSALALSFPVHFESAHMDWLTPSREIRMEGQARISGEEAGITADRIRIRLLSQEMTGAFSEKNIESLEAEGQVRLHHQNIRASALKARYQAQDQQLQLEGTPAEIHHPDIHVTGLRILYAQAAERLRVEGAPQNPTTMRYSRIQGEERQTVSATSLHQDWDMKARTLTLKGSVHVTQADMALKADHVLLRYPQNGQPFRTEANQNPGMDIQEITAEGHVEITHPSGKASGDRAVFSGGENMLTLTGSPARMERDGHLLQGPAIRMNPKTGEVQISGGVSGTLIQEKGQPFPMPF